MKKQEYIPDSKRGQKYLNIFKKMVREKREWQESLKNVNVEELLKKSIPVERPL